jgi:hypothetical protein
MCLRNCGELEKAGVGARDEKAGATLICVAQIPVILN